MLFRSDKTHQSLNSTVISKSNILDALLLGYTEAITGRRNLNPKETIKRTKIKPKKLLPKSSLHKGSVLEIISRDDLVLDIQKKKNLPMG